MLIYKLSLADKDTVANIEKLFGISHPNLPPANFREVDEVWLAKNSRFHTYGFEYTWFAQIYIDADEAPNKRNQPLRGMHFFGDDSGEGFALYTDYWAEKVRYFAFAGCLHDMKGLSQEECRKQGIYHGGRCYHVSKCQKCGWISVVDSSD